MSPLRVVRHPMDPNNPLKRKREELELRKMESEITAAVIKNYQELCKDTTMDERAKDMFKDAILSNLPQRAPVQPIVLDPNAGLLSKFETSVPIMGRFVDLKHMLRSPPAPLGEFKTMNELKQTLNARAMTKNLYGGMLFHAMGFQYVGPRITEGALAECKIVQEAFGVEKNGIQFVILVMMKLDAVKFPECGITPYELKLVPQTIMLGEISPGCHMSLYKQTPTRLDCPVMDAIKQAAVPPAHKWIWQCEPKPKWCSGRRGYQPGLCEKLDQW